MDDSSDAARVWDRWNAVKNLLLYTETNMCLVEAKSLDQGLTDASLRLEKLDDSKFAIFLKLDVYTFY